VCGTSSRIQTEPGVQDLAYWVALHRTPGVGPRAFGRLLERYGAPRAVFDAGDAELAQAGVGDRSLAYLRHPDWRAVERALAWSEAPNRHIVPLRHASYPALLAEIVDPPPLLYVRGDVTVLARPQLAMVGSRNPSPSGGENAYRFARSLTQAGLTITSGLAVGIDGASHRGALAGNGATIAVAGTGVDRVYPACHADLAEQITRRGAIISELPLEAAPAARNFPRRNRIISGLCLGVLVVEAARHSGSLITARLAAEQGREVFAIPGSIHNPLSRGCHALLREGAKLVETAQDILEELLGFRENAVPEETDRSGNDRERLPVECQSLLDQMGFDPVPVDELVERCGLTAETVSSMLLVLELQGHVSSMAGGLYARRGKRA
jgi:DNA processing protein